MTHVQPGQRYQESAGLAVNVVSLVYEIKDVRNAPNMATCILIRELTKPHSIVSERFWCSFRAVLERF